MVTAGEASARVLSQMNAAETELDVANRTRSEVDARLAAIRDRLSHERPVIVASRATTGNPIFQRIQSYLVDLEIRRTQLAQLYTPQHPRMQALSNEIADVRNRMLAEAKTMVGEEITHHQPGARPSGQRYSHVGSGAGGHDGAHRRSTEQLAAQAAGRAGVVFDRNRVHPADA